MHGNEPIPEGQFACLHDCPAPERRSCFAARALVLLYGLKPIMACAATFSAYDAFLVPEFFEFLPAGLFIGKMVDKIDKIHIKYFSIR